MLTGCISNKPKPPPPEDNRPAPIDQINLLAVPVALDFDGLPGPDGFVVKVYAGNRTRPKPVPLVNGTLEVLMFDGLLEGRDTKTAEPHRRWTYSAEDLKAFAIKSSIGTGYQLAPRWEKAKPTTDKISILAHYTSPEGASVYSAASIIAVPAK